MCGALMSVSARRAFFSLTHTAHSFSHIYTRVIARARPSRSCAPPPPWWISTSWRPGTLGCVSVRCTLGWRDRHVLREREKFSCLYAACWDDVLPADITNWAYTHEQQHPALPEPLHPLPRAGKPCHVSVGSRRHRSASVRAYVHGFMPLDTSINLYNNAHTTAMINRSHSRATAWRCSRSRTHSPARCAATSPVRVVLHRARVRVCEHSMIRRDRSVGMDVACA